MLSDDPSLQPFVEKIIKCVLQLRQLINFQMHTMAGVDECKELDIPQVVSSSVIDDSDRFFNNLTFRYCGQPIQRCHQLTTNF